MIDKTYPLMHHSALNIGITVQKSEEFHLKIILLIEINLLAFFDRIN